MSLCNGLAETVREGIQHAVMGMHRWQAVLLQLISNNAHQFLHALVIISPITYNLKTREQRKNHTKKPNVQQKSTSL